MFMRDINKKNFCEGFNLKSLITFSLLSRSWPPKCFFFLIKPKNFKILSVIETAVSVFFYKMTFTALNEAFLNSFKIKLSKLTCYFSWRERIFELLQNLYIDFTWKEKSTKDGQSPFINKEIDSIKFFICFWRVKQ